MSQDFQLGRHAYQAIKNLQADDEYKSVFQIMGSPEELEDILKLELENEEGGSSLGKLASCFMDSLSTIGIPAVGYGLRSSFDQK